MDILPPELLCIILSHTTALDDANKTLRSISAVSRYLHAVAVPFLYTTVEIYGETQIRAVVERLEKGKGRVRDMFIADVPHATREPSANEEENDIPPSARPGPIPLHLFARLLVLTASSLCSLSLHLALPTSVSLLSRLYRTTIPLLYTLSISGLYPFPGTPRVWPNLRVLRLDGNQSPTGLLALDGLREACPRLQCLEVTSLGKAGGFLGEVEEALEAQARTTRVREGLKENGLNEYGQYAENEDGDPSGDGEGQSEYHIPSCFPPSLKRLTLQAAPSPTPLALVIPSSHGRTEDVTALKDLLLIARLELLKVRKDSDAVGGGVHVEVLERQAKEVSAGEMRRDWVEGLGRVGRTDYASA